MKRRFSITIPLLLAVSNIYTQTNQKLTQEKIVENKILDTVLSLPEVKSSAAYIEKRTKGKRHLASVIYRKPGNNQPYYWVKVWEDNGYSYVSWYNFYVYPKTFLIKYLDTAKDKAIDLATWRKRQPHTNL